MAQRRGHLQLERNGTWTARIRVDGKAYCRATGTHSREEAEASLARLAVIADCGRKRTLARAALLRAWPRYEASAVAARLAPSSRRAKYRAWLHFSVWLHGTHPEAVDPALVTRPMAEEYLAFFRGGHAPVTCALRVCFLREVFRVVLAADGAEARNPWDGIHPKAGPACARRELSLGEVERLLAAAAGFGREWRTLFFVAAYTGMRLGDCCRLRWESVDLAASAIRVVPQKTRRSRAGRPVVIPLHPALASILGEMRAVHRSGYVMDAVAHDFETRRWAVSRTLARIFAGAGIGTSVLLEGRERRTPLATFHSLRHTFVSVAVNAGVPLAVVQAIVGHASSAMTRHYYHPSEEALRQAVCAMPAICAGGARPSRPRVRATLLRGRPGLCARLRELTKARKGGLISAEEFDALRRSVLADA